MISNPQIQQVLSTRNSGTEVADFLKIHTHMEAYLRRILLIALRLNGADYEVAREIASKRQFNIEYLTEAVITYLAKTKAPSEKKVKNRIKQNHPDLAKLRKLFLGFTACLRNQIAHGTREKVGGEQVHKLACHVDQSYYTEFERMLLSVFKHSAFEKPGAWGAKQGHLKTVEQVRDGLGLEFRNAIAPKGMTQVLNVLQRTQYQISLD